MTTLSAFALLAVWCYVASCTLPAGRFNPYVYTLRTALFRPVTALQRFAPRLSEGAAAVALLAIAALALALLPRLVAADPQVFVGRLALVAPRADFARSAALLAGTAVTLLAQLSLLRLALLWRGAAPDAGLAQALGVAAWPLSRPADRRACAAWTAAALLAAGWLRAWAAAELGGFPVEPGLWPSIRLAGALPLRLALLGAVDLLQLVRWLLLALCLLSWLSLLPAGSYRPSGVGPFDPRGAAMLASDALRELTAAALGGRADLAVGAVSFGPLLVWWLLGLVHPLLAEAVL